MLKSVLIISYIQLFVPNIICSFTNRESWHNIDIYSKPKDLQEAIFIIGALHQQLNDCKAISSASLARDTLEEFRDKILIPKYLSANDKKATCIRSAYFKFLHDQHSNLSKKIRAELQKFKITKSSFVEICMGIYRETTKILHVCYQEFRIKYSFDEFLAYMKNVPKLNDKEKQVIEVLSKFV